jgi:uncharacterized protein with beta-barrel porin domain
MKKIKFFFQINLLIFLSSILNVQATVTFIDSLAVHSRDSEAVAFAFNNDGSKMFVVGCINDSVDEYSLSTNFDVSTASFVDGFDVSAKEGCATGLAFNNDGSKMFISGFVNDKIHEYDLSTNFDVSTASFVDSLDISNQEGNSKNLKFNSDGSKLFIVGDGAISRASADNIIEYHLTTSFDISTASYDSRFSVYAQETQPTAVAFNSDGTKMFVYGNVGDDINEYSLSTGFDVSTASFVNNFTDSSLSPVPEDLNFNSDGTKMFALVRGNGSKALIKEYSLSSAFNLFNPTLSSSSPADDASDVSRDANIILNFSESVDVETGNITIKKRSDDSTVETIDVTSGQVTGTGTSQITVNLSTDFIGGLEYYILIDATAFDDATGNSYAGISSTTALSFTVVAMQDPTTNKDVVGSIDAQINISKNYAQQSINIISNRLNYLRQNKSNSNSSSKNIKLDFFGNAMLNSLSEAIQIANNSSKEKNSKKWSSWSEGVIAVSKTGDSENSSSFEIASEGFAIGFDKIIDEKDFFGFAFQLAQSDSEIGSSGSSIDSANLNISFYRSNPLDNDNFIEGLIGFGLLEKDLVRKNGSNTLIGSRNGSQIFGSINFGKKIDKGDLNLTPIARLDLAYTELSAYSETGTDALSYSKQTIESGLASIGLEVNDIIKFNNSSLKPFGSAEYTLDFSNSSNAKMNYSSDTSTIYTYIQGVNSNHFISSEIGFKYMTSDNLNIIASYKRTQGNESQHTDQLNFTMNYKSEEEIEYKMIVGGSEELTTGFEISKNLNGFDLNFNANQSLNGNSNRAAEILILKKY